jgi:hypothetical protein
VAKPELGLIPFRKNWKGWRQNFMAMFQWKLDVIFVAGMALGIWVWRKELRLSRQLQALKELIESRRGTI